MGTKCVRMESIFIQQWFARYGGKHYDFDLEKTEIHFDISLCKFMIPVLGIQDYFLKDLIDFLVSSYQSQNSPGNDK